VSQLWSSHPVCCGGRCGAWVAIGSPLMQHMCHGRSLHPVCCGGGCSVWVTITVFTHAVWGRGRCRCGACVAVTVFPLCVVVVGAVCGSPLWSSCAQHGAVVAINAAHVSQSQSSPCVLWSWVQCMGSRSWSSHTWHGATVTIDAVHALRRSLCVSWLWVQHVASWLQVLSLQCVHCGCHLCAVCGVAVALLALRGVSPVPLLC
jgi:hypothetical protein